MIFFKEKSFDYQYDLEKIFHKEQFLKIKLLLLSLYNHYNEHK